MMIDYRACACLDTSRRRFAPPKPSTRPKTKRPAQTKRNIGKERAAALNRLPARPLFLLPIKICVIKTFVASYSYFSYLVGFTKLLYYGGAYLSDKDSSVIAFEIIEK